MFVLPTPPFALYGGSPLGGVYYEADTVISTFNPYWQNIGLHEITMYIPISMAV